VEQWERRERWSTPDGDRLAVCALSGTSGVRVHLFHGLSGDIDADYMRRSAAALRARGHEVWLVNHRGCGSGRGLAAGTYHSGVSPDMQAVLAASRAEAPDLVHLVVGFSLSGNVALLLAAQGLEPLPDGLVAVNPPADLARASVAIGRGLNRLYELRFLWRLRRAVRQRERDGLVQERIRVPALASLMEFDDLYTAPRSGFADGQDYSRRCSSLRIPTSWPRSRPSSSTRQRSVSPCVMSWNALETRSSSLNRLLFDSSRISARLAPAQKCAPSCEMTNPFSPLPAASTSEYCMMSKTAPSMGLNSGCNAE